MESLNYLDGDTWRYEHNPVADPTFSKETFMKILLGLNKFYKRLSGKKLVCFKPKDFINPPEGYLCSTEGIVTLLQLILGVAVNCEQKSSVIDAMM